MCPTVNNGFIRSPGKAPRVGGSSRLGEGSRSPWEDSHSWKKLQRKAASAPPYSWRNKPIWGGDNPRSAQHVRGSAKNLLLILSVSKVSNGGRDAVIRRRKQSHRIGQGLV